MQMSQMHYLPLAPGFFAILVGFFFIVLILRSVRYAYESLGVSSSAAIFLLFATLIGSFFNIPIAELSPERVVSDHVVEFFGMRYVVPVVSNWLDGRGQRCSHSDADVGLPAHQTRTMAERFGGDSHRRLGDPLNGRSRSRPWHRGADIHARPGDRRRCSDTRARNSAPLAYIGGSLGTLIGADLTNLDEVRGLGAPVASIGGAGTFDRIFLTGILAVLLASLYARPRAAHAG